MVVLQGEENNLQNEMRRNYVCVYVRVCLFLTWKRDSIRFEIFISKYIRIKFLFFLFRVIDRGKGTLKHAFVDFICETTFYSRDGTHK